MATDAMKLGLILSASNRMGGGVNSALGMLGKFTGALGLASLAWKGFDAIKQYDDSIQSLSAVTGVSGSALEEMKSQVMSLAKESKKSGYEIAKAFENVGSNMSEYLTDPKGLREISAAGVVLSKASRMEVAPALDNLTTIMNQFDLKAKDAAASVNRLTAGEIVGNVRTANISTALQEFGASAKQSNVNLGESVALIEVLGKKIQADKIGVAGRNLLVAMSAAKGLPREALVYLEKYGVSTQKLMNPQESLISRLKELSKISGDNTAMVKVFGKENITAAQVILNNLPLYEDWEKQIQNTNKAQDQANTNSKSFINRMNELKASFDNVIISENESTGALGAWGGIVELASNHMQGLLNLVGSAIITFGAYKAIVWGVTAAKAAWVFITDMVALSQDGLLAAEVRGTAALKLMTFWTWATSAATWAWGTALWATGIPEFVLLIVAVVAVFVVLVKYWDEITKGAVRFGKALLSSVMTPIIWVLKAIGKLTGAKWAINLATNMQSYKDKLDSPSYTGDVVKSQKTLIAQTAKQQPGNHSFVYNPTININSSGNRKIEDRESFAKLLRDNAAEFGKMMQQVDNKNKRLSFGS